MLFTLALSHSRTACVWREQGGARVRGSHGFYVNSSNLGGARAGPEKLRRATSLHPPPLPPASSGCGQSPLLPWSESPEPWPSPSRRGWHLSPANPLDVAQTLAVPERAHCADEAWSWTQSSRRPGRESLVVPLPAAEPVGMAGT